MLQLLSLLIIAVLFIQELFSDLHKLNHRYHGLSFNLDKQAIDTNKAIIYSI